MPENGPWTGGINALIARPTSGTRPAQSAIERALCPFYNILRTNNILGSFVDDWQIPDKVILRPLLRLSARGR
jgi:hypothetical protein